METNGSIGKPIHARGLNIAVREGRKHLGWTKRQMSRALSLPLTSLWRIERGTRVMHSTAWLVVSKMIDWPLPEDQRERLHALKERLMR